MSDDESTNPTPRAAPSSNPKSRKGGKFLDKEEAAEYKHMKRQIRKMEFEHRESSRQLRKQLKTINAILENTKSLGRQVEAQGKEHFERAERLQKDVETLTAERDKLKDALGAKESEFRVKASEAISLTQANVALTDKVDTLRVELACTKEGLEADVAIRTAQLRDQINELRLELSKARRGCDSDSGSEPDMNVHGAPVDPAVSINALSVALGGCSIHCEQDAVQAVVHLVADQVRLGQSIEGNAFLQKRLIDVAVAFRQVLMNLTLASKEDDLTPMTRLTCFGMRFLDHEARGDAHAYMKKSASRHDPNYRDVRSCVRMGAEHSLPSVRKYLPPGTQQDLCETISFLHYVMDGQGVDFYEKVKSALGSPIVLGTARPAGETRETRSAPSSSSSPAPSSSSGKAPAESSYIPRHLSLSLGDALSEAGSKTDRVFYAGIPGQHLRFVLYKPLSFWSEPVNPQIAGIADALRDCVHSNQPVNAGGQITFHGADRKYPGRLVDLTDVLTAEFVIGPGQDVSKLCAELNLNLRGPWPTLDGKTESHPFYDKDAEPGPGTTTNWLERLWAKINKRAIKSKNGGTAMSRATVRECVRRALEFGALKALQYRFWYMDKNIGAIDASNGMPCTLPPHGGVWAVRVKLPSE